LIHRPLSLPLSNLENFSPFQHFPLSSDIAGVGLGHVYDQFLISTAGQLPSVIVFAVIGVGYKSDLFMIEGSINAGGYI
jgi:hypothetical protein